MSRESSSAEALVISHLTAGTHVRNILRTLGVTARAQVDSWAATHGLAPIPSPSPPWWGRGFRPPRNTALLAATIPHPRYSLAPAGAVRYINSVPVATGGRPEVITRPEKGDRR
jgi:hypothetical protein